MIWGQFQCEEPDLAKPGEELFDRTGLVLVGTIRADGCPRIIPAEPILTNGHLYLGMMWQSRKALDFLRDPRCTGHNAVSQRHGTEGEFKVYGRAVEVTGPEMRRRFEIALRKKIGWSPSGDDGQSESKYHLCSVDIESVAYGVIEDGQWLRKLWKAR